MDGLPMVLEVGVHHKELKSFFRIGFFHCLKILKCQSYYRAAVSLHKQYKAFAVIVIRKTVEVALFVIQGVVVHPIVRNRVRLLRAAK